MKIVVGTLNILGTEDRWRERFGLIREQFAALRPDLFALQEVDFGERQDELIAEAAEREYVVLRAPEDRPDFGNSLLVAADLAGGEEPSETAPVELGGGRSAVLVELSLGSGTALRAVCTHLHYLPDEPQVRVQQVERLLDRLSSVPPVDATLLMGDLNAPPEEPLYELLTGAGFASAHAAANGVEPEWTYPSPSTPPDVAVRPPSCIDYVWVGGSARVLAAGTAFDTPAADDPSLYPSDHCAVVTELEIG